MRYCPSCLCPADHVGVFACFAHAGRHWIAAVCQRCAIKHISLPQADRDQRLRRAADRALLKPAKYRLSGTRDRGAHQLTWAMLTNKRYEADMVTALWGS